MITIDSSCRSATADALLFVDGEDGAGAGGGGGGKGLPALVQKAISMCERDLQPDLLSSVVLAGGTTMLPGFSERLKHELVRISAPGTRYVRAMVLTQVVRTCYGTNLHHHLTATTTSPPPPYPVRTPPHQL